MEAKKFIRLFVLEIAVLSTILAYFFIDSSDIYRWYAGSTNFSKQNKLCDLHKSSCEVILKDGSIVKLDINPKNIPLMKPIKLTIITKNINLKTLSLQLFAMNMNMGFIKKDLKKIAKNRYEASVILPSCIIGGMIWNANIIVNKPTKSLGAIFEWTNKK